MQPNFLQKAQFHTNPSGTDPNQEHQITWNSSLATEKVEEKRKIFFRFIITTMISNQVR
jgi:hypothetical protein